MKVWKIDADILAVGAIGTNPNHAGTWGNENGTCLIRDGKVRGVTHKDESNCPAGDDILTVRFRIKDDDGELYYEGRMTAELSGSDEVFRPLNDFATPNDGATSLEIYNNAKRIWQMI